MKKGYLVEQALLHHLQALRELPADIVIPPRITVTSASFEAVTGLIKNQFRHHLGTTYVAIAAGGPIAGFATVSASEISPGAMPTTKRKGLPKYPLPVLRLARLAVDEGYKGQGVGSLLLRAVLELAARMTDDIGCVGGVVVVRSDAVASYDRLGFVPLEVVAGELGDRPQPFPMFLELGQLARP